MRVVLVYFQPSRRNVALKCALNPKIAKNSLKIFFRVQGRSRSSMLINLKKPVTSACYDKPQANNGKITSF